MSLLETITGKKTTANKTKKAAASTEEKKEVKAKKDVEAVVKTEKTVKEKAAPKVKAVGAKSGVYGVLVSPLVTEKSAREEQLGKYAFAVDINATKSEVIKAVETRYGVKPVKVNILNRLGKVKRFGRSWGKRKDWRKAVVTLPKGKSINIYESK